MRELITSAQNPKIKELLALQEKSRLRRKEGLFVLEGRRELERCVAAGMKVRTLFVCPEIFGLAENDAGPLALSGVQKNVPPGGKKPEIPAGGSENVPPDRMALGDGSSATPILPTPWVPSLFGSQCRLTRTAIPSPGAVVPAAFRNHTASYINILSSSAVLRAKSSRHLSSIKATVLFVDFSILV